MNAQTKLEILSMLNEVLDSVDREVDDVSYWTNHGKLLTIDGDLEIAADAFSLAGRHKEAANSLMLMSKNMVALANTGGYGS
jgi:hypothetical protein